MTKKSFYQYHYHELESMLLHEGLNTSAAAILFNWHYKKKKQQECTANISKVTLEFLQKNLHFNLPQIDTVYETNDEEDRTVKFLFKLHDGNKVESVLLPFQDKYSLCISSQVGCAMKCAFCFTGTQGLKRNLTTDEIVGQFLQAWSWLAKNRAGEERILNIVFMGQGEPLHNFDHVKKSCEIFLSNYGTSIGHQKITISTSGYIPGLKRWNKEMPGVNLALSLHSPFTEKRNELIPINKKYPLDEVLTYLADIPLKRKQFITYEYLLIDGFNDSLADAHRTGELLKEQSSPGNVNLIPFNPFPGSSYKRPRPDQVERFKDVLNTYNIQTLIRGTKGDAILAACGQLNTVVY